MLGRRGCRPCDAVAVALTGAAFCIALFVVGWINTKYFYLFFLLEVSGGITAPLDLLLISYETPQEGLLGILHSDMGDEELFAASDIPAVVIGVSDPDNE